MQAISPSRSLMQSQQVFSQGQPQPQPHPHPQAPQHVHLHSSVNSQPLHQGPLPPLQASAPVMQQQNQQKRPARSDAPPGQRMSRACERCHTLKARCVPGDKPGVCLKCQKTGSLCHPHKRHRRSSKYSTNRVLAAAPSQSQPEVRPQPQVQQPTQLQSRPLPQNQMIPQQQVSMPAAPVARNVPIAVSPQAPHMMNSSDVKKVESPGSAYPTPIPEPSSATGPMTASGDTVSQHHRPSFAAAGQDPIDRELLTLAEARQCVASFSNLHQLFPCVDMDSSMEFEHVRRNRPFLFLCILATTTSLNPEICAKLDVQVKETIAQRIIVQAEKCVDLLEGILVYLAWYHFHFKPSNQRPYQILQLAIGMTIDLGYPTSKRAKFDRVTFELSQPMTTNKVKSRQVVKIDRAVVACWYLSSTFSMATSKPNNFTYGQFVSLCFRNMSKDCQSEVDKRFLQLVSMQKAVESNTVSLAEDLPLDSTALAQFEHVKQRLEDLQSFSGKWQSDIPSASRGQRECHPLPLMHVRPLTALAVTTTACEYSKVLMYEATLQCLQDYVNQSNDNTTEIAKMSLELQRNLLKEQLEAVKSYLDAFLRYSIGDLVNLTMVDWIRLTFIFSVLSKLALTERGVQGWNSAAARETVKLDHFLEILSYRTQKISTGSIGSGIVKPSTPSHSQNNQPAAENFAWAFHYIMETMQMWYASQIRALAARPEVPADGKVLDPCPTEYIDTDARSQVLMARDGQGEMNSQVQQTDVGDDINVEDLANANLMSMDFGSSEWSEIFGDWTLFPDLVMANYAA